MIRLGILGGTFNPVHNGHLLMAHTAAAAFGLERVLLVPSSLPPHKELAGGVSAVHRLAMLRLAAAGDPLVTVDTVEIDRGGVSYAIDTVRHLAARDPGCELFFIIGLDSLLELHRWKDVTGFLSLCRVVTVNRPGILGRPLRNDDLNLPEARSQRLLEDVVSHTMCEASSSEIRERIAKRLPIGYLVPESVERYIRDHALYGSSNQ
ncbi:MAG: nicotinate-nucleotide adenylyltransferase, partial [Lentisphaerota bacterium]